MFSLGCIGSIDCVHIRWDNIPAMLKNLHVGKEGYETRSFEVTVNHRRRILAETTGFYGSYNDKTRVRFDRFVNDIRHKTIYRNKEYEILNNTNSSEIIKGVYLI